MEPGDCLVNHKQKGKHGDDTFLEYWDECTPTVKGDNSCRWDRRVCAFTGDIDLFYVVKRLWVSFVSTMVQTLGKCLLEVVNLRRAWETPPLLITLRSEKNYNCVGLSWRIQDLDASVPPSSSSLMMSLKDIWTERVLDMWKSSHQIFVIAPKLDSRGHGNRIKLLSLVNDDLCYDWEACWKLYGFSHFVI